jgi:glycosyltransferase involved in cell wall biosynthesis
MPFNSRKPKKVAIVTTHPIQYNAPFFKLLSQSETVWPKVFYTWGESVLQNKYDPDFQRPVDWDIPLLEGYEYEFPENTAKDKGSHHFNGIVNPKIIDRIKQWKPDAILVYGWKFRSHLKVMRYFKNKVPVWFRGDSTLLDEKVNAKSITKSLLLKWVYQKVDLAFYTGFNNKEYFLTHGLREDQLIKASHAVENERFSNKDNRYSEDARRFRENLNIPCEVIVFLFAGKLTLKKGLNTLIEAFRLISTESGYLLIVGNGPLEKELKESCREATNILFVDFQNQERMPVVYAACDVFVLPSLGPGESWGLSVNEAMAAGKAVIVSNKCGSAVDLVLNGKNGFVFEADCATDAAEKMKLLADNKEKTARFGNYSLAIINQFTFNQFVSAIENAVSHLE